MAEVRTIDLEVQEMLEEEAKVYEVSFHIIPSLTPDDAKVEFESVKKILSDREDGSIISEGQPALRNLAYTLTKTVKAVKTKYNQAYFAWIKFTARPHDLVNIKKAMDERDQIIRYLIISTVRENTMINKEEMDSESADNAEPMNEEELDRTIDELVVE